MANLGDFFELVFAAKVYQRLNPENYSINIKNNKLTEKFDNKVLNSIEIPEFIRKHQNLINGDMELNSEIKKYKNSDGIVDTISCSLKFQTKFSDINQFILEYTNDGYAKNKLLHIEILNFIKDNGNVSNEIKEFLSKENYKESADALQKYYDSQDGRKRTIKSKKDILKTITENQTYIKIKNILEADENFTSYFNKKSTKNFNNLLHKYKKILDFDIHSVHEVNELINKRNEYLLNGRKEYLKFKIYMEGETKINGTQGKTDIKIIFLVSYIENKSYKQDKFYYNISLKFESPKIETASKEKFNRINQYFARTKLIEGNIGSLKTEIIKLMFDSLNITNNQTDSLIVLSRSNKKQVKRLDKKDLIYFLDNLKVDKLRKQYDVKKDILKILYGGDNLLTLSKRINQGKTEYEVDIGNIIFNLNEKNKK